MRNGNDIAEKESLRRHQIVLTVPMRNGNSTVYAMQFEAVKVLTVPMRNGNEAQAKAAQIGIWQPQLPQQSKTATQNIEVLEYSSSVKRGGTAYVKIKGIPGTRYNCSVKYKSGYSSAAGLGVKTADDKGYVSWSWKIGSSTTQGSWPIIITNLSNSSDTVTINFYVY